ncbi:hypothetical protein ACFLRT_04350 [Acidobacteriota bacterium]
MKKIFFDEKHGQPNWGETGYPTRQIDTTFAGVASQLRSLNVSFRQVCIGL